jgi:small subunit ribosomal protein S18
MINNMKKQCYFSQNNINYIDYKDVEILKKFLNPHGRIIARSKTGVTAKNQRKLAEAVKRARFMGLLPFVSR